MKPRKTLLKHPTEVELVNVQYPAPSRAARALGKDVVASWHEIEAAKALKPAEKALRRAGADATARYAVGTVANELASIVAAEPADLIVMGSPPRPRRRAQSGWVVVGLLTQTLVVHMIRSPKLPLVQTRSPVTLACSTLGIAAIGLWLPMGPLAPYFRRQTPPWAFFAWLAAILVGCGIAATLATSVHVRRFG